MPGGKSLVTLGPSAKSSRRRSARAYKYRIFWTSILPQDVRGSEFIVKVSRAEKFNLEVPGGLGRRGNIVSSNTQF